MSEFYFDDSGYPCFEPEMDYIKPSGYINPPEVETMDDVAEFLSEISGRKVTFGYIGNIERWGDDRSFRLFANDSGGKCISYGGFDTSADLVENFRQYPTGYIKWATKE